MSKNVVHTGAAPGEAIPEVARELDVPGVTLIQRGPCKTPEALLDALQDADISICYHEPYTREVLANVPRLKAVIRTGVGVDTVDLDAATDHGIIVANFPDFCTREVANHAIVLMMACAKKVGLLDRVTRHEGWNAARAYRSPMGPIHGQTLGLIAFGAIARAAAKVAQALEMRVIAYDPYVETSVFKEAGVEPVSLETLAERSDYVSCHLPLTSSTQGMLDAAFFARMKPTAYFVNTGRGGVVAEADLITALEAGQIAGAGLDVFESEPIATDHPLLAMDQVVITPHTASYADETFAARDRRVGRTALAILAGETPEFVANRAVLEKLRQDKGGTP
jgi:D-3-phosphoglycerate dehydrogenase